jgi:hypothetical protein
MNGVTVIERIKADKNNHRLIKKDKIEVEFFLFFILLFLFDPCYAFGF